MIKPYKNKKGETKYRVRVYLGKDPITGKENRKQKSGFNTVNEAKIARLELLEDPYGTPEYTFEEIYHKWFKLKKIGIKEATETLIERQFRLHILPAIGKRKIDKITVDMVQELALTIIIALEDSFKSAINRMKAVFEHAKKLDIIRKNP